MTNHAALIDHIIFATLVVDLYELLNYQPILYGCYNSANLF